MAWFAHLATSAREFYRESDTHRYRHHEKRALQVYAASRVKKTELQRQRSNRLFTGAICLQNRNVPLTLRDEEPARSSLISEYKELANRSGLRYNVCSRSYFTFQFRKLNS